jgi:hypothetical protein
MVARRPSKKLPAALQFNGHLVEPAVPIKGTAIWRYGKEQSFTQVVVASLVYLEPATGLSKFQ